MNAFRKNLTAAKTHDEPEKIGHMATGPDPIQLNAFPRVFGWRSIYGRLARTAIDTEDVLAFGVLENIRPMIETLPLEQAADASARMMQGKARFRMVQTTGQSIRAAKFRFRSRGNKRYAEEQARNAATARARQ
jgi:D-arabinose 1-dehydrogenase-like Zn-dependent alcohol dehydrogenase